ncbi:MucR family transcriptional regulator [Methylobacterium sp. Leaf466]|uniref:MucR family transcriptional regulator n=1 Tax=Methylobacterium sp. Leaf466 TaxID=1736386 RepID=UPI0006F2F36C|nr:MucR family transcriptional regulator [Methylobacterium sp. Leaf466]KQT88947.1 MucR family transcriptional regulator [Methylobacterium sp. Leaf466]
MDEITSDMLPDYVELAADIVSAYVSKNAVPVTELASLVVSVHTALSGLAGGRSEAPATDAVEKPTLAQIKDSITPDVLISFEDGKSYKTMRRHLTLRGLTAEAYREKYGLPHDYPMTSPAYSALRAEIARSLGLGQLRKDRGKAAQRDNAVTDTAGEATPKRAER